MSENLGAINEFVQIDVKISGKPDSIETTAYTEFNDLFESHFKETFNDPENLKQYGIDVYKIKIGDELKVYPSKWTTWFCEDKGLPIGDTYDFNYRITDIEIKYYSKHPGHEDELPRIEITIEMERI
jgi:hypothetical protein